MIGIILVYTGYKTKHDELGALGSCVIIARYGYLKEHYNDRTTKADRDNSN